MKSLGISMAGGGAKAFCYFGFVRGLERAGITIDYMSGHSGAALMLCLVASELSDEEIIAAWARFRYWKLLSFNPVRNRGVLSIDKYTRYMRRYTRGADIAQLKYRTIIYTSDITDYDHPKRVVNESGDLALTAVVSSLVPPLFPLYRANGKVFGDGGFTSGYSAATLRDRGADVVVGLFPDGLRYTKLPLGRFVDDTVRAQRSLVALLGQAELATQPVDLEVRGFSTDAGLRDFRRARDMYDSGVAKAQEVLPTLLGLLGRGEAAP